MVHETDILISNTPDINGVEKDDDGASSSAPNLGLNDKLFEMGKAYANIVCTMAGTGILQLPYTLSQGGWLMVGLLTIVAFMALHTGRLTITNLYVKGKRLAGYPESGEAAFGKPGLYAVQVFHKATVMGVSTLFLILAAQLLSETYDQLSDSSDSDSGSGSGSSGGPTIKQWTMVAAAIVVLPTTLLANVDALSFASGFGGLVTVAVVVGVVAISLTNKPSPAPSHTFADISSFPIAFSGVCLSFGGHACFPTIQENMSKCGVSRRRFLRALDISVLTLLLFYLPTAVVGYYVYGNDVESPVLSSLPGHGAGPLILKIAMTINVLLSFPILQHVLIGELERKLELLPEDGLFLMSGERTSTLKRLGLRWMLVGVSTLVACLVPYFADMMALVGALCVAAMVFVFPCAFAIKLHEDNRTSPNRPLDYAWMAWLVVIMVVGVVGGGIGAVQAFNNLVDDVDGKNS